MTTPSPADATATAYWTLGPAMGELRAEPLPTPLEGEVLVRTLASGISRGTEGLVHRGLVPSREHERMRAPFQKGDFPWPVKYGYMAVGVVEAGAPDLVGRRVFCLHPHQTAFVVPAAAVLPLADDVPDHRALLVAQLETALTAIWDGGVAPGDRVAVIGAGVIGSLVAYLAAKIIGTDVIVVDRDASRIERAAAFGAGFCALVPEDLQATEAAIRSRWGAEGADVVFHASGAPTGLACGLLLAGQEATVVELSWYGDTPVHLELGADFHSKRLTLRASQVSRIPPAWAPRWTYRRRLSVVASFLRDPGLDVLVAPPVAFETLPARMNHLMDLPSDGLCHPVSYAASHRGQAGG